MLKGSLKRGKQFQAASNSASPFCPARSQRFAIKPPFAFPKRPLWLAAYRTLRLFAHDAQPFEAA